MKKTILEQLNGIELIPSNSKRIKDTIKKFLSSNGYNDIIFDISFKQNQLFILLEGKNRLYSISNFSKIYKPVLGANKVEIKKSENLYYQPGYKERLKINNDNMITIGMGKDIHPAELEQNNRHFKPLRELEKRGNRYESKR